MLAGRGDRVIAAVRDPALAKDLAAARGSVRIVPLDVSDPASIRGLAARIGDEPIDVLINNAGVASARLKAPRGS